MVSLTRTEQTTRRGREPEQALLWQPVPVTFGTVAFEATHIPRGIADVVLPGIRSQGSEVDRLGRRSVNPFVIDSLTAGFRNFHGLASYGRDKTAYWFNEGLWGTWLSGVCVLPYKNTTQTALLSLDASGYTAAALRVHSAMFNRRFIACMGPNLVKDTSTSDPTLVLPATADNITNNVLSMWEGVFNNVRYLVIGSAGQTDDVKGTTDPTAASITWVELVTHGNATDAIWAGGYHKASRKNLLIGQLNGTNGVWSVPFDATVPVTAPTAVVKTSTKDLNGSLATVTISNTDPTVGGNEGRGGVELIAGTSSGGPGVWQSVANIFSSNDVDARYVFGLNAATSGLEGITSNLIAGGFDFSTVPLSAILVGLTATIECAEDNALNTVYLAETQLLVRGSVVGQSRVSGAELGTTDAALTLGSTTDDWGPGGTITGADLRGIGLQFKFVYADTDTTTGAGISVDHVRITSLVYRMPGTQITELNQGGFGINFNPANPDEFAYVNPLVDDTGAITTDRELTILTVTDDPQGNRLVAEVKRPALNLPYVGVIAWYLGGLVAFCGASSGSAWTQTKLVDAGGIVRDLGMPAFHGTNAVTVTQARAIGSGLLVDTAYLDGSEAQRWMYYDGRWFAAGVQQDKASAISTAPLLWAETTHGTTQQQMYRFFPVSTTSIAAAREFFPFDWSADPNIANLSQTRQDGPLGVIGLELDMAAPEGLKCALTAQIQTHYVDTTAAAGSYGTVRLRGDTGGDKTLASAEIDVTFGTGAGQTPKYTDKNLVASANNPGINMPTAIWRIDLDHAAGSAESPNGLNHVVYFNGQWQGQRILQYQVVSTSAAYIAHLLDDLEDLRRTKPVQRLKGGVDVDAVAQYERPDVNVRQVKDENGRTRQQLVAMLTFTELPGGLS